MQKARLVESPRVTKPYSDEQWLAVDKFGRRIEQQLKTDDVRLTIGGEPTFIAMDDPDAPEWNTAAAGPTKRRFAADLIQKLRARFAPEGCCTTARASGTPASSCRVGRSVALLAARRRQVCGATVA